MRYKLYNTSQKAWDGMFTSILGATKSIYIEMYSFLDDTKKTHDFLDILRQKAQAGVEVVIIVDIYGSMSLKNEAVEGLRQAGVEFLYFSRWFRRTHRKILIIDERIAFLGGVNIVEETRNWFDLQIKLQGRIIVPVLRSFSYAYEMAGGEKESILSHRRAALAPRIKSWITDNLPGTAIKYRLSDYYRERIRLAKHKITIVTPYLMPPRWLIAHLDEASHRGVKIDILIPNDTDVKIINKINYYNACQLASVGVKFFLLPMMNHAKIMLIDGEEGVIGSQNLDILSFNWNIEVGVFFRQKKLVRDLDHIISAWRRASIELTNVDRHINLFDRLIMSTMRLFYRVF